MQQGNPSFCLLHSHHQNVYPSKSWPFRAGLTRPIKTNTCTSHGRTRWKNPIITHKLIYSEVTVLRKKVLEQFNCFEMNIFRTKTCILCKYTQFQSLVLTVVPLSLVTSAIPAILKNITNFIEIHTYNLEQFQLYGITLWTLLQFPLLNYIKQKLN